MGVGVGVGLVVGVGVVGPLGVPLGDGVPDGAGVTGALGAGGGVSVAGDGVALGVGDGDDVVGDGVGVATGPDVRGAVLVEGPERAPPSRAIVVAAISGLGPIAGPPELSAPTVDPETAALEGRPVVPVPPGPPVALAPPAPPRHGPPLPSIAPAVQRTWRSTPKPKASHAPIATRPTSATIKTYSAAEAPSRARTKREVRQLAEPTSMVDQHSACHIFVHEEIQ